MGGAPSAIDAASGVVRCPPTPAGRYTSGMALQFTAIYQPVPEGFIGWIEELPGANTQARTLDEARTHLQEAVTLILEANRQAAQDATRGEVIREPLTVAS
jgi:predicted RNase H-like HicB family nuclease